MKRILSIDGGGIRGILPGQILVALEQKIQLKTGNQNDKIANYFDMIAGTSTGGILACFMLCPDKNGLPKYNVQAAVDLYLKHGDTIFHNSLKQQILSGGGIFDEKYDSDILEDLLKEKLGADTTLRDLQHGTLITAYDIENRKAKFFNALEANDGKYNFKLWEVARATSAAPTYFEPAKATNSLGESFGLIDGGVFANNPALCAYVEARQHYKNNSGAGVTAKDMFLVSIGTGAVEHPYLYGKAKNWGLAQWIKPLVDIMMSGSAETVDFQLQHIFASEDVTKQYHRIEPSLNGASIKIDDVSTENLQALKIAGENAALQFDKQLDEIVEQIVGDDNIT